jgi:carnitine O-palmitoyltransferase 2
MQRSFVCRVAAPTFAGVPDLRDWSRFEQKWAPKVYGTCFDKTVLDDAAMPTMHLQRGLFRLPIPKLEITCKRYLDAVKPIVPPTAFEKTQAYVNAFQSGAGNEVQAQLIAMDKAFPQDSYISADWFDLYLRDRTPLPINYNPSLITRKDKDKEDGLVRAAFWIASSLRWYQKYRDNTLKPEVFFFCKPDHYCRKDWFQRAVGLVPEALAAKAMMFGSQFMAFPLDMSQYASLFNSTRIPQQTVDTIKRSGFTKHIIVNYRGHQFTVNVADDKGAPLSEGQIYARLKAIVDTNVTPAEIDVGVLTADNREQWAETRINMLRHLPNERALTLIDEALFVLNLDLDTTAVHTTSAGAIAIGKQLLCHPTNRWWDKSFSVTVTKDGTLGVGFEHSWGDGVAILRYTVDTFNDSIARSASSLDKNTPASEAVNQLQWELTDTVKDVQRKAKAHLEKEIRRCDYYMGMIDTFGKSDKIFKGKVKPDPFMQVAMQLAWWRLYQSTVSTYESASTAAFKRGRTECIRSATQQSQDFTLLFDKKDVSDADKLKALIAATNKHAEISKDAKMGHGVDRHLFALRKITEREGKPQDIFTDQSYKTFGSNIISTSSLYSDALVGGGFGPVSPGYGVGYAAADEMMIFNISSWTVDGPTFDSETFAKAIYASASDMKALIERAAKDL